MPPSFPSSDHTKEAILCPQRNLQIRMWITLGEQRKRTTPFTRCQWTSWQPPSPTLATTCTVRDPARCPPPTSSCRPSVLPRPSQPCLWVSLPPLLASPCSNIAQGGREKSHWPLFAVGRRRGADGNPHQSCSLLRPARQGRDPQHLSGSPGQPCWTFQRLEECLSPYHGKK